MVTRAASSASSQIPLFDNLSFIPNEYHTLAAVQRSAGEVIAQRKTVFEDSGREPHMPPVNVNDQVSEQIPAAVTFLAHRYIFPPAAAAPIEIIPQTSTLPLSDTYLGPHPILGPLKFEEIVTIAKQSLEYLAELQGPIYLNPIKMVFDPQQRRLSLNENPAIYYSQFMGGPFYLSPEMILDGTSGRTADIWSLGCILFELMTGQPLFISGLANSMLHQIAGQIGMPPLSFLHLCKNSEMFFSLEPEVQFEEQLQTAPSDWKERILITTLNRGIPQNKSRRFIKLLEKMFSYENRGLPHALLGEPLFQDDIRIYLSHNFSAADKLTIFGASEIEAWELQPATKGPLSFTRIDGSHSPIPPFVHLPRDPFNQYFLVLERNGVQFSPDRLRLMNGYVLDFIKQNPSGADPTVPA